MSGVNLKCATCGREFMAMPGDPGICCGVAAPVDGNRWYCPTHNVRYGGPRETAKCPECTK